MTVHEFVFSKRRRPLRHVVYWSVYIFLWACFWTLTLPGYWHNVTNNLIWVPLKILYCYPFMYFVIPRTIFKEKYLQFALVVVLWGIAGWYLNYAFLKYAFIPMQSLMGYNVSGWSPWNSAMYLCLCSAAAGTTIIKLSKYWFEKQQQWMNAEQEKVNSQIQLLKAQLHPHFLFNTLNNIYSFALEQSPKTPQMILKLSSLLSYMLYDCRADEVLLEKEVEVMKNYIDLEKERYGDKIDISLNIEGDIQGRFITPLLILPFLENAFKHGTSEQLDKPWMSVDIEVKDSVLQCKVVNSKNEAIPYRENGVGITNLKKRLELLYPNRHELKLSDERDFFVVALTLRFAAPAASNTIAAPTHFQKSFDEPALSFN